MYKHEVLVELLAIINEEKDLNTKGKYTYGVYSPLYIIFDPMNKELMDKVQASLIRIGPSGTKKLIPYCIDPARKTVHGLLSKIMQNLTQEFWKLRPIYYELFSRALDKGEKEITEEKVWRMIKKREINGVKWESNRVYREIRYLD